MFVRLTILKNNYRLEKEYPKVYLEAISKAIESHMKTNHPESFYKWLGWHADRLCKLNGRLIPSQMKQLQKLATKFYDGLPSKGGTCNFCNYNVIKTPQDIGYHMNKCFALK